MTEELITHPWRCPKCGGVPEDAWHDVRRAPCCNPDCCGTWGTGCYHCHHPSFLAAPSETSTPTTTETSMPPDPPHYESPHLEPFPAAQRASERERARVEELATRIAGAAISVTQLGRLDRIAYALECLLVHQLEPPHDRARFVDCDECGSTIQPADGPHCRACGGGLEDRGKAHA